MKPLVTFRQSAPVLLLIALAATPFALAQSSGLEVAVLDHTSAEPAPGIHLILVNEAIGFEAGAVTNAQGKARFPNLSTAGSYRLEARGGSEYHDQKTDGIHLRSDRVSSLTVALERKSVLREELEVIARIGAARVNTVDAEVSATLRPQEIEALPIEGRDVTRALYRLPNVTQATGFYPEAPNVSINGANSLFANYLIDGLDNNENFLGGQRFAIPVGFVQDVTVLTSAYSAEFGRTGNGIFNVTSRSGSNELGGEFFYVTRPGQPIDASSSFAGRDLSGNAVKDGFERQQFGLALGGPIVKDRTFYYFNLERTRDVKDNVLSSPALGVADTVRGENRFEYASLKLDHHWNDALKSSLRLHHGNVEIERQGGGLDGGVLFPSAGSRQNRDSRVAAFKTTYSRERFIAETGVQFSSFDWGYVDALRGPGPQVTVYSEGNLSQPLAVLGHPGWTFDEAERSQSFKQKLTWLFENHTLQVGGELVRSDFDLYGGGNASGNYRVSLDDAQLATLAAGNHGAGLDVGDLPLDATVLSYDVELRPTSFGKTQENTALWIEDLWSVNSRLNLTLGLRWDYDNLSKGGSGSGDTDNVAPRFSFNYKLDERSVLRGGAGLFYDKILYAVYSDALQQNTVTAGYRRQIEELVSLGILPSDTNVDRVLHDGNVVASFGSEIDFLGGPTAGDLEGERENVFSYERRILNPNGYDNPRTWQFTLGYQRQLRDDMLFYVDLIHTRAHDLFRLRNLNAPEPWEIDASTSPEDAVRTAEEANATRPLAGLGALPGGALNIVMSESAGRARYSAATFTLLKDRARHNYSYRVSYTLSRLENDTDDINFRAQNSNRFDQEWGPSLNDRTHVIHGLISYHPLPDLTLTLAALVQSGQPVNRVPDAGVYGTTDLNGDGRSFADAYLGNSDRQPGQARNSDRLPWSKVLDFGVRWRLPWVPQRRAELFMDVFNVLNTENLSGYSNNATQSNQIQVGPPSQGIVKKNEGPRRQFQFGVRYVF